jgi:hypothetical protein
LILGGAPFLAFRARTPLAARNEKRPVYTTCDLLTFPVHFGILPAESPTQENIAPRKNLCHLEDANPNSTPRRKNHANNSRKPSRPHHRSSARTPAALNVAPRSPEIWTQQNEGKNTWSAFGIVGHLIHAEHAD